MRLSQHRNLGRNVCQRHMENRPQTRTVKMHPDWKRHQSICDRFGRVLRRCLRAYSPLGLEQRPLVYRISQICQLGAGKNTNFFWGGEFGGTKTVLNVLTARRQHTRMAVKLDENNAATGCESKNSWPSRMLVFWPTSELHKQQRKTGSHFAGLTETSLSVDLGITGRE